MEVIKVSGNEKQRLLALDELKLLPVIREDNFDNITRLASFICKTPVSLITVLSSDKQYFKASVGTELTEAARNISHCTHAILNPEELLEIPDTREDERFANNPYTTAEQPILFYAGMPIKAPNGAALGTLCVLDTQPRQLQEDERAALKSLAHQVENLLELRRQNLDLKKTKDELKQRNSQLKDFAATVAHDMKMPLTNIILTADLFRAKYNSHLDEQGKDYLDYIKQSSFKLSNYIQGILDHYESDTIGEIHHEEFDIHDLLEQIIDLLNINYECEINLPENNRVMHCNRAALEQIFLNLIGNSLKYNDKEKIVITVECDEDEEYYYFSVQDNGIGIPRDKQEEIFKLFTVVAEKDRTGNKGNGIGLSTETKLIDSLGGEISVDSQLNSGTVVNFSVRRTALC